MKEIVAVGRKIIAVGDVVVVRFVGFVRRCEGEKRSNDVRF